MTQEEIKKYADELAQQYFPDEYNIWARENVEAIFVSEACMKMAKYVEQELIKKAREWWEQRQGDYDLYDVWNNDYVSFKSVIMDFCEAMEE